ncbi:MAG: DUF5946 family protein [Chloroflexota bacterium]|nr:DUF5946 family protein [Chloroflexota bacterium]MDQ5867456.1 DUF5946 family protein [Chloroflexota bacterium]
MPDINGPTHRYIGASPGCWQAYGELLAGGYGGESTGPVHRLTVDIYAAQHPGVPGKQSSQSVVAHLFVLCLVLERGVDPAFATRAITQFVEKHKERGLAWMEPPPSLGELTVLDVMSAGSAQDHNSRVMRWAESVWHAWTPHHPKVRAWAEELGY